MSSPILADAMVHAAEYLSHHEFLTSKGYTLSFSVGLELLGVSMYVLHRDHYISSSTYVSASELYASPFPQDIIPLMCDQMIDNLWPKMEGCYE